MYQITSEVYLDLYNECYKNILVIYPKPKDPSLNAITKPITREKLSPFDDISPCCPRDRCMYAVVHPYNKCELFIHSNTWTNERTNECMHACVSQ